MNPNNVWEYEFNALVRLYESKKKSELKNFGAKLSKGHFIGKDPKNIAMIVRNGFQYVFDNVEERCDFLIGIKPFLSKLNKNDVVDLQGMISREDMRDEAREAFESIRSTFEKRIK
jgi:hypothetical protein